MFTMAKVMGGIKQATPESFWPLPGDSTEEQVSQEEVKEIAEYFAKLKSNG
jgi:hypothetical protein